MSIFSRLFKKDAAAPPAKEPEFNFKQRVEAFWVWFGSVSERFYQTIEDKQCSSLADEVSQKVNELLPGMAWVFGPGVGGKGHSFTLSGEGYEPKQILARYWLSRAPEIAGWTFYAARQAEQSPGNFSLEMGDLKFEPIQFWVTPEVDEEREHVDLTVWHPLADQAEKSACQSAFFLTMDEIFGELGTGRWIGYIDFSQAKLGESMPILELKEFIDGIRTERKWKMHEPGQMATVYKIPPEKRGPEFRNDTISGSTVCWTPLRDFLDDPGKAEDPFAKCGANWVYVSFDSGILPEKKEVDARYDMEDLIGEALRKESAGSGLGGAIGVQRSYMDFLIYDGSRSIAIIREAAQQAGLPAGTRLEYLAAGKKGMTLVGGSG